MNEELTKNLCDKFPKIFNQNFYFECDDGWYDLIKSLCQCIQFHCDHVNRNIQDEEDLLQVEATQVKEKFGTLRFYVSNYDDAIDGMIRMAESISFFTCEACGNKGSKRSRRWIKTYCESCHTKNPER